MKEKSLAVFEDYKIRRVYDEGSETWYFSVVDIIQVLIQQPDYQTARNYWKVLKNRLNKEGSESVTKCNRLKMVAEDGKMRLTDVADPETLLRLIQSVPSPKAEPIKLWLAKVGYERMQDMADPERSLDRAREYWHQHGRSEKWIQQRMMGQETRNKLTDYWKDHEIKKGLLICCKSFSKPCENRYPNITVKKIPKMLLGRCEFGKEDYSLNIVNMPVETDTAESEMHPETKTALKKPKQLAKKLPLFGEDDEL